MIAVIGPSLLLYYTANFAVLCANFAVLCMKKMPPEVISGGIAV